MREWRSEIKESRIAPLNAWPKRREAAPAVSASGILAGATGKRDAAAHARLLRSMIRGGEHRGKGLLELQRCYGNRYTQRVLALARSESDQGEVSPAVESNIENARGAGQSLDSGVRGQMESAFGADFGGVRVHTDHQSHALNQSVGAVAFTTGQDIFFGQDAYAPRSSEGRGLLAHELTHVVQQGGAGIRPKLALSDPGNASEQEADRVGKLVAQMPSHSEPAQVQSHCACGGTCEKCSTAEHGAMDGARQIEGKLQRQAATQQASQTGDPAVPGPAPVPTGGCPTKPGNADPRAIHDTLCLLSQGLTGDDRLNDAFHNNPPLTAKDNGTESMEKFQQALLDVGEVLPRFGVDGKWGDETTRAVASFQGKNGIPVGGFEAGRKTLLALDAHLQQNPPKPPPPPPPSNTVKVDAKCGPDPQSGKVVVKVEGGGFPSNSEVDLTVDGAGGNAALSDKDGTFSGSVPADLKDGSHVVKAKSGSVEGLAQFSTPCRVSPPPPTPVDPGVVTQNELLVLTKYQFQGQVKRDATEDAIRDLQSDLDPAPVPFFRKLLEGVLMAETQFVYGAFEQVIRTAIKGLLQAGAQEIVDNANDKASDSVEDWGKDSIKDKLEKEDDQPQLDLKDHLEKFRRTQLGSLNESYFKLETEWIGKVAADPKTANITPEDLQGLGRALDQTSHDLYTIQYDKTVEAWASYIAQIKVKKSPGPSKDVSSVTDLSSVDDKDPKDVPGVLLIKLIGSNDEELPTPQDEAAHRQMCVVAQGDIHIYGLSKETREELVEATPDVAHLAMPVVLRGQLPRTWFLGAHGHVAIGKDEAGQVKDAGSDERGKKWLIAVGQMAKSDPRLSDPDVGARAVFSSDLSNVKITGRIQGP